MVRKTPRSPEEARTIARALRQRFISPEVEAKALETLKRLNIDPASLLREPNPAPPIPIEELKTGFFWGRSKKETILSTVREREGIVLPESDKPFTDEEKRKAKAILALFKERYGIPEKPN